ncbi:MAG TPA: hypothetical protein VH481_03005 [Nitrososphaeraceae archaeon]|jgi:hypothetical protein
MVFVLPFDLPNDLKAKGIKKIVYMNQTGTAFVHTHYKNRKWCTVSNGIPNSCVVPVLVVRYYFILI